MFEVETSNIEAYHNLVMPLAVDEGCFNMDEARIWLMEMNSSRAAMLDSELPWEFFDNYLCEREG